MADILPDPDWVRHPPPERPHRWPARPDAPKPQPTVQVPDGPPPEYPPPPPGYEWAVTFAAIMLAFGIALLLGRSAGGRAEVGGG